LQPTKTLANYVEESQFSDFPEEVVQKATNCILDAVGCAIGGAQTTVGKQYVVLAKELDGKRESTLIGDGNKVTMVNASYANTQLGNVLDFDDVVSHPYSGAHPGGAIIHSALAVGEAAGVSGREILTAVVMGYEVSLRIARAIHSTCEIGGVRDVLLNSGHKVFGAAVAAGALMGLNRAKLLNAFGIAGSSVPGTAPGTSRQTRGRPHAVYSVKGNFGLYAMIGTLSALQAREGLTGSNDILDGNVFWTKSGALGCGYTELTRNLGREYEIMKVGFKPVPCCRWTHGAITAVWNALEGRSIVPNDIQELMLIGTPRQQTYAWDSMLEAEFSTPCAVAMAILGGEPGPDWYITGRFQDQDVRELAKKVKFFPDPEADDVFVKYGLIQCTAKIKTKTGKLVTGQCVYMKGEPENPLSDAELERKFLANSVGILGQKQARQLMASLRCLSKAGQDLHSVVALLGPQEGLKSSKSGGL